MRRDLQIFLIFSKALFSIIVAGFLSAQLASIFGFFAVLAWPVLSLLLLVALDKPDFWTFLGQFKKTKLATLGTIAIVVLVILGFAFGSMHF
jgi:hypothetical protein